MAGWPHHRIEDDSRTILKSFMENKDVFAIVHKEDTKVLRLC